MARKTMSSLDVYAWVSSAKGLLGERVDNVYQAGDVVGLKVRSHYGDYLVMQPAVRVHTSSRYQPGPELTPLVRSLRDNIRDSRISGVSQAAFDRVVELTFEGGSRVVVELIPRGVVALVSPEGKVIAASYYMQAKDRSVRRGAPYAYPPLRQVNPFTLGPEQLREVLAKSKAKDLVRALVLDLGVPGEAAEEAAFRAGISPSSEPQAIKEDDVERLARSLASIYTESAAGRGYVYLDPSTGQAIQATPFKSTGLRDAKELEFETFDEALDYYFSRLPSAGARPSAAEAERQKLLKSLEAARAEAERYAELSRELEEQANAVASNYYYVERALECARSGREDCEGVKEVNRRQGYAEVVVGGLSVKIYLYESVDDAIKRLYREAGELRAKSERAKSVEAEMGKKLEELEEQLKLQELRAAASRRKRAWYERYHWLVTGSGLLAVGGRDADQNESLVRKLLGPNDVFLHADIHGAPAVVLLARGRSYTEEDLLEAGLLTAVYSKAWKAGMGSVSVYWALGSQVSKSPPAGEYLAKGSFMVYGKKNYLRPYRMELYLGVALDEEGLPVVVVGTEDLVRSQSLAYVRLVPGDMKVEEAADEAIARMYKVSGDDRVRAVSASEVSQRLPGRCDITLARKGQGAGLRRPKEGPLGANT